ncbi:MAG: D-glycero-beta-D-manno-heptose-7-phosphate kinase [Acidobacteria bacterium]|nr:MAG: D-glycero-beta-D-manno-heptose-7-phosphate kinase [Acidobacteriota bacterium]
MVGDLMIDQYLWGGVSRISPEAPVPVVRLERESFRLGGAGNVVNNLVSLGARAIPAGVRGDDRQGELLETFCRDAGIPTEALVLAPGRPTTVKTRVIAHNQQVVRVDREVDGPLEAGVAGRLAERALSSLERVQGLVVSDYDKGGVSADLLATLLPDAARRRLPIVVDPKVRLFRHYRPATVVTPNSREAMEATGMSARTDEEFETVGRRLLEILDGPCVLITRGERGMLLLKRGGPSLAIPATAREVFDVTGAGDTVAATLALALGAGADMEEAALLANRAAGVVVGKVGTATLTVQELLDAIGQ